MVYNANPSDGYFKVNPSEMVSLKPDELIEINMPGRGRVHVRADNACSCRVLDRSDRKVLARSTTIDADTVTALDAGSSRRGICVEIKDYAGGLVRVQTTADADEPVRLR